MLCRSRFASIILRGGTGKLSNNIIQKGLAFGRDWSGTVANSERHGCSEILPRRLDGRGGASVVRRDAALIERRISMSKSAKKRAVASSAAPVPPAKPSQQPTADPKGKKAGPGSKQSRVIAMLQSPAGATVASMMKATGWQQHSVRGFLAGVVRKRLKLKLESKKVDGTRVYQIASGDRGKPGSRRSKRQSF
jgi:Protein of unknown function (DUF3489)